MATAAITGTVGDGATEAEIVAGGGTIIITLTGDTWIAGGAEQSWCDYTGNANTAGGAWFHAAGYTYVSYQFVAPASPSPASITKVQACFMKVENPTGDITCAIYDSSADNSGGVPTGSPLCSSTVNVACSSLPVYEGVAKNTLQTWTMDGSSVTGNRWLFLVFTSTGTIDGTNYLEIEYNAQTTQQVTNGTAPTTQGNYTTNQSAIKVWYTG